MTVEIASRPPLPDAWRWAKLGEVCRIFTGSPAPQGQRYFADDGPFFFRVRDLGNHRRTMDLSASQDKLSPTALADVKLVPVRAGSVLFPKSGAAIATNNRALLTTNGYIVSHLMALEPKERVTSEWIYHLLCRVDMMDYADNIGYPSLKKSVVERIEVPIPPLEEQRRIVARLDERMAVAERARLAADRIAEAANSLKISLLREILPLGQNLPKDWRIVPLGEVCEVNPRKPADMPYAMDTLVSFIPMANAKENAGGVFPEQRPLGQAAKGYTYFEEGDVLFAKITPCMQNGKHNIARGLLNGFGFGTTEFHVIRPSDAALAEWIHNIIRQPSVLRDAEANFEGTAGQQRVPKQFLENLPIPLPPLGEQRRIVARLDARMAVAEHIVRAAMGEADAASALGGALLRGAFGAG